MCIVMGCEILPSTGQKIYSCQKSQALAMSMVSHKASFQVIEKDVKSDDKQVLHAVLTRQHYVLVESGT